MDGNESVENPGVDYPPDDGDDDNTHDGPDEEQQGYDSNDSENTRMMNSQPTKPSPPDLRRQ